MRFLFLLGALTLGFLSAQEISAEDALYRTRAAIYFEDNTVEGQLRADGKKTPVTIAMHEGIVSLKMEEKAGVTEFGLDIKEATPTIWLKGQQNKRTFTSEDYSQKLAGTDFAIEDLAMRFLYWQGAKYLGEEKIKGQETKIIYVQNPDRTGPYQKVHLWIIPESGTLMQMEAYDWQGKKVTRYRILSVMNVDGRYTLERLKVESLEPNSGKVKSYSYLEFFPPKRRRPGSKMRSIR